MPGEMPLAQPLLSLVAGLGTSSRHNETAMDVQMERYRIRHHRAIVGLVLLGSACSAAPAEPPRPMPPSPDVAAAAAPISAASASPESNDATSCADPATLDTLPWKTEELFDIPKCLEADRRMRRGAALLTDFATVRECIYQKAAADQRDAVDEKLRQFYDGRTPGQPGKHQRFFYFNATRLAALIERNPCLPKEFADEARDALAMVTEFASVSTTEEGEPAKDEVALYLAPKLRFERDRHGPGTEWLADSRFGAKGHFNLTRDTAKKMQQTNSDKRVFSDDAVDVMADASRDVDDFCWTHMPTHAQTAVHQKKLVPTDEAQRDWAEFVMFYVREAAKQCNDPKPDSTRHALYRLGFVLHAVQDLTAHQGRSNEEHSFNAFILFKDPDTAPGAYELGLDVTRRFLTRAVETELKSCISKFATFKGTRLSDQEKKAVLHAEHDLNPLTGLEYVFSAWDYPALKKNNAQASIRWITRQKLPETCATNECSALLDKLFASKPLASTEKRDHCLRRLP